MQASVARKRAAEFQPSTYGFEGATVEQARDALVKGGDRVLVKLGMREDGSPEAWLVVMSKSTRLYVGNVSYTCPPRPPEYCDE